MWAHFQDLMVEEGVTNVQWSLDFSAHISRTQYDRGLYAAQWPGDDRVDWLFWNFFQFGNDLDSNFYQMTYDAYSFFEENSGVPIQYEGETFVCNFTSAKWGL